MWSKLKELVKVKKVKVKGDVEALPVMVEVSDGSMHVNAAATGENCNKPVVSGGRDESANDVVGDEDRKIDENLVNAVGDKEGKSDEIKSKSVNKNTPWEKEKMSRSIIELRDGTKRYLYSGYDADALKTPYLSFTPYKNQRNLKQRPKKRMVVRTSPLLGRRV
ncbi:hypothetical protein HanPI659440_Chr11g0432051 [Helianthus annuus]|nr:hypothetical protein HanPI659440_Chr11g0432051 [Helianthus annuus]